MCYFEMFYGIHAFVLLHLCVVYEDWSCFQAIDQFHYQGIHDWFKRRISIGAFPVCMPFDTSKMCTYSYATQYVYELSNLGNYNSSRKYYFSYILNEITLILQVSFILCCCVMTWFTVSYRQPGEVIGLGRDYWCQKWHLVMIYLKRYVIIRQ